MGQHTLSFGTQLFLAKLYFGTHGGIPLGIQYSTAQIHCWIQMNEKICREHFTGQVPLQRGISKTGPATS